MAYVFAYGGRLMPPGGVEEDGFMLKLLVGGEDDRRAYAPSIHCGPHAPTQSGLFNPDERYN